MTATQPPATPDATQVASLSGTQRVSLVRGRLEESTDERIILSLLETDYRLHLVVDQPVDAAVGSRITGRIFARAMRADHIQSGGRFIEPVFGRPRRLQGRIVAIDPMANTLTLRCACPITCELTADQRAADFRTGELVCFDVQAGARFEPLTTNR